MRYLVVGLVSLLVGALFTLILMNSLRQGTSYPNGVMAVMAAQMKGMGQSLKQNRCTTADLAPRLQTLRHLGNDLEPAFFPTQDDALFGKHASSLRAALDAALAAPPSDCATAKLAIDRVSEGCKACHTDFKG